MDHIGWQSGTLCCDGVDLEALAAVAGTPLYVYSASLVRERCRRLHAAFRDLEPQVRYAVKANGNGALLRLLLGEGAGFDLVSGGELARALRAGADPRSLVFAGVGKQDWEIERALAAGIGMFNVESEAELERLRWLARQAGTPTRVALRVNPDVAVDTHAYIQTGQKENKFGVDFAAAHRMALSLLGDDRVELVAYHVHLGSQLYEPTPYLEAASRVAAFLDAEPAHRDGVRFYDMGGGFGTRDGGRTLLDLDALAAGLRDLLRPRGLRLLLEPGRFLIGDAGLLLTRVLQVKPGARHDFYVVDAAMNDLIRPALYGAEHEIVAVRARSDTRARPVDVVGPVCESADFLGRGRRLPDLERGDLLAVLAAGAYGFAMASNYNSRPLPAEVLCENGGARLVRRRQSLESLWQDETDEGLDVAS